MAVMKMIALTMVGPRKEMEPMARQMVLSGGFQPIPLDFLVDDRTIRAKITTESNNPYDKLLSKMATVWSVSGEKLPEPKPVPLDTDFSFEVAEAAVKNTTKKLEIWKKRRDVLVDELERLDAAKKYVEALDSLHMSPSELAEARFVQPHFGRLSPDNFVRLKESTPDAPLLPVELSRTQDSVWVIIFTVQGYREGAKKIMDAVYFKEYPLNEMVGKLGGDAPSAQVERAVELHRKAIGGLEKAAGNILSENREALEELYSKLYTMQRVYDLLKGRGDICGMYVLSGWIPEDTYMRIKDKIEVEAPRSSIIIESVGNIPYSGVRIPTMLRNNRLVRAFQDVVAMYSVPSYGEVDPSPFVALTFILFFGFMFGDVGHGIMLFLGAWYLEKKSILSKSLAFVMKCASCSSVVFGFLYGSVMGMEDLIPAIWLSPMHDTGKLFFVAIVAGVVMISAGMILNMILRYRERDFGRLLFDGQGLAGLFVYWGAGAAVYVSIMDVQMPFPVSFLWYAVIAALLLTLFRDTLARTILHERTEKQSTTMLVFEVLHNLMNYFTNTASFVRLAAFALNHVALSFAVMLISNMMGDLPGGFALKAAVLILGNIFIVGLEGLIVFIQVLRLEYYEFFSKFYKGGGNVFQPVTWKKLPQKS